MFFLFPSILKRHSIWLIGYLLNDVSLTSKLHDTHFISGSYFLYYSQWTRAGQDKKKKKNENTLRAHDLLISSLPRSGAQFGAPGFCQLWWLKDYETYRFHNIGEQTYHWVALVVLTNFRLWIRRTVSSSIFFKHHIISYLSRSRGDNKHA